MLYIGVMFLITFKNSLKLNSLYTLLENLNLHCILANRSLHHHLFSERWIALQFSIVTCKFDVICNFIS